MEQLREALVMAKSKVKAARESEQRGLLVITETALAAESAKEAQERTS